MDDIILKTEDVGVTYQDSIVALENVSLKVPAAKLTAILGPSGCGKTTLLKVIAGLIEPSTGTIKVRGKETIGPGPDRALVFQDFALLPWAGSSFTSFVGRSGSRPKVMWQLCCGAAVRGASVS